MKRYNTKLRMDDIFPAKSGLCRHCDKPLKGQQRKWCSKECGNIAFDKMMLAKGGSTAQRKFVFERDKGICAGCGLDCEKLQRVFRAARISAHKHYSERNLYAGQGFDAYKLIDAFIARLGYKGGEYSTLWQADHIQEVRHGGAHDLSNLQTLCLACHKSKTARNFKKTQGTTLFEMI